MRATEFWAALADAWRANPVIRLREIQRVVNFAGAVLGRHETAPTPTSAPWDPMPTVAHDGGVVMLSPELAGFTDARFGDFTTGNVLKDGLDVLVAEAEERISWITEFWQGVDACRATCPAFAFCGGAHAANRLRPLGERLDQRHLEEPAHLGSRARQALATFDNRPTWDDPTATFDNRPTGDNWKNK
ncbi:multiple cyclophane-containing RiPP AmcA [Streptomyces sp. NPDC001903]|uniref:multiple cyclophane-containing RiPP AmcA n=1 Tax=Streptomyces sp. NPDC001903 TaxID=3364622 RepID=UPI0036AE4A40